MFTNAIFPLYHLTFLSLGNLKWKVGGILSYFLHLSILTIFTWFPLARFFLVLGSISHEENQDVYKHCSKDKSHAVKCKLRIEKLPYVRDPFYKPFSNLKSEHCYGSSLP